jgi:ABC-2 type transport system ATP-binding protein
MIKVDNLYKSFGDKQVLCDVSFQVAPGEVLGFLGPNGAGKSTTMRIITGFLEPSSGSVQVCGFDVTDHPLKAKETIGYLPESAALYEEMRVGEFLKFITQVRGLSGASERNALERVCEQCHLEKVWHQAIETLSKGFRQRTGLAQALIHDPQVLILDEPTDGLDPNQKFEIRELITSMGRSKAIVFSTHVLEEVEAVCSRAMVINSGVIVANGTPQEFKAQTPSGRMDDFFRSVTLADTATLHSGQPVPHKSESHA